MPLDIKKLSSSSGQKQTEPRKIFTTLSRTSKFKRPSDEQADVLDSWYKRKDSTDITLKMNTGAGKTVVGLLCLQSSLNENIRPAVYVAPTQYLVNQVVAEAGDLGIKITTNPRSPDYRSGAAILVINIHKLVNARSAFGLRNKKIPIGAVVIDDAHACLSVVEEQFSIVSGSKTNVYKDLLKLFASDLKRQSKSAYLGIEAEEPDSVLQVPYWAWQQQYDNVIEILHENRDTEELEWRWPLLKDDILLCSCVFGRGWVEIFPMFIPIDVISAFVEAKRRIYMTATLADDTVLVSSFEADEKEVRAPIRPKGGGDIGDRMILIPQIIDPSIVDNQIKFLAAKYAESINVVVIVPSYARADYWDDVCSQTLNKDNIQSGVEALKERHVGLTVIINKYDGIDLPGEACELLIIDGLPEASSVTEQYEVGLSEGTETQLVRQVQRIEQGMGRGVRSSDDYCAVLLMGNKLAQRLHDPEAWKMFSSATRAQLDLGKSASEQLKGQGMDDIRQAIDLCLSRNSDWVAASREAVVNSYSDDGANLDRVVLHFREAFNLARKENLPAAIEEAEKGKNAAVGKRSVGAAKQRLAQIVNLTNPVNAQEIQTSALSDNSRVLKPIKGTGYSKLIAPSSGQATAAANFNNRLFSNGNDLAIWVNGVISDLLWNKEGSLHFEEAIKNVGLLLGYGSQRPEQETGKGPDNLWALNDLSYLVIECKSGAVKADNVSKKDVNQLSGSINWFKEKYDNSFNCIPVIIHPKTVLEYEASPVFEMRIIDNGKLESLECAIRGYTKAIASSGCLHNANEIDRQLASFGLKGCQFVGNFSIKPRPAEGSRGRTSKLR